MLWAHLHDSSSVNSYLISLYPEPSNNSTEILPQATSSFSSIHHLDESGLLLASRRFFLARMAESALSLSGFRWWWATAQNTCKKDIKCYYEMSSMLRNFYRIQTGRIRGRR